MATSTERTVEFFARAPLLSHIEKADLTALVHRAEQRFFAAGQMLFQRGEPGDGVFAIVSGKVKVYLEGSDGGEVIVAMRTTGDVLGELSLLDNHRRSASAAAVDKVQALRISTDHFQEWLSGHPSASLALLRELAQRLRDTTDQVAEIAILSIDERIARRIWQQFAEAAPAGEPVEGQRARVNQSQLATIVGLTRESVNKHLARMKQQGIINIEAGRVVLLDPSSLRAMTRGL